MSILANGSGECEMERREADMANKAQDEPIEQPRGVACPRCGCRHLPVYYTRHRPDGSILRRRQCRNCGRMVTTYEKPA